MLSASTDNSHLSKYLTTIGVAIVAATVATSALFFRTDSELLISQDRFDKLTPTAQAAVGNRQGFLRWMSDYGGFLVIVGCVTGSALFLVGLLWWRRHQKRLDRLLAIELETAEKGYEEATPDEKAAQLDENALVLLESGAANVLDARPPADPSAEPDGDLGCDTSGGSNGSGPEGPGGAEASSSDDDVDRDETPDEVPDETPDEVPDETPDEVPDETPVEVPDETPVEVPDETTTDRRDPPRSAPTERRGGPTGPSSQPDEATRLRPHGPAPREVEEGLARRERALDANRDLISSVESALASKLVMAFPRDEVFTDARFVTDSGRSYIADAVVNREDQSPAFLIELKVIDSAKAFWPIVRSSARRAGSALRRLSNVFAAQRTVFVLIVLVRDGSRVPDSTLKDGMRDAKFYMQMPCRVLAFTVDEFMTTSPQSLRRQIESN